MGAPARASAALVLLAAHAGAFYAPPPAAYGPYLYPAYGPWRLGAWPPGQAAFLQLGMRGEGDEGGSGSAVSPYEHYFHHDGWGRVVTAPRGTTPEHTHRWLAQMDGRTTEETEMERAFINGHGKPAYGAQYVTPCPTFPYCNYVPPPPSMIPPPYQLSAPAPRPAFPNLGIPPRMHWHPAAQGLGLSSGPMRKTNPNNLNPQRPSVSVPDKEMWKRDLRREQKEVERAQGK